MKKIIILIATGSTGGHIFPGIALKEQLIKINPKIIFFFLGYNSIIENKIFRKLKYNHIKLSIKNLRKIKNPIKFLKKIITTFIESNKILKKINPTLIISMGGYPAGPISILGRFKNIPIVICEQNIILGLTNRLLTFISERIYISFKNTRFIKKRSKVIFSGNPIREKIININKKKLTFCKKNKFFTIFIIGGSQGSHFINKSFLDALPYIKKKFSIKVIHQTGFIEEKKIKKIYKEQGISSKVKNFFQEIYKYYSFSDLIITRGGASIISEIIAIGKCSIIIPNPFTTHNHQFHNSNELFKVKAAKLIIQKNLSGINLAEEINHLMQNKHLISKMENRIKNFAIKKASKIISYDIHEILRKKNAFKK